MTVQTRLGISTHGVRGITNRDNRRLAIATQGLRGYISFLATSFRRLFARILSDQVLARVLTRR